MGAALAKTRQVIAVEMQGRGRTADSDRPMTFETAIRAAAQHPHEVRRLAVISRLMLGRPGIRRCNRA
jgi:hypothetical protein